MNSKAEIVVVGSHAPGIFVKVKRIPRAGETVIGWDLHEPKDGGKGSNQAIAAALLEAKTSFVGCFGRDRIGDEGEKMLAAAGVDTQWLKRHKTVNSGGGFILLDDNGVPAMVTSMGANAELTVEHVEAALCASAPEAKIMLTQFEIPLKIVFHAVSIAHDLGMISILNPGPAPENLVSDLKGVDILIPNQTEAQVLLGQSADDEYDAETLARELKKKYSIPTIIITLGEEGFLAIDNQGIWKEAAHPVDVVDTSGAGDAFCSALAVALTRGKTIREASKWANRAASLSVAKPGTIDSFPTLEEVIGHYS